MSCDRRCFNPQSADFGHEDCHTCPGRDDRPPSIARVVPIGPAGAAGAPRLPEGVLVSGPDVPGSCFEDVEGLKPVLTREVFTLTHDMLDRNHTRRMLQDLAKHGGKYK